MKVVHSIKSLFGGRFSGRFVVAPAFSALALIAFSGSAKADLNLVTNGGFETTTLTSSGQINTTNVTGWSSSYDPVYYNFIYFPGQVTTAGVGAVDTDGVNAHVWMYGPGNSSTFPVSPDGGNFLAADADTDYNGAITQTINGLTPGQTYDLSFYWGGAQYTTRTGPTTESWQVSLGSETKSTGFISDASESFTGWQLANMQFQATSTSEVLSFLAVGTPNGEPPVSVLDGVSLVQAPEPGYSALMFAGVGALVFAARRRRKSASQLV
jgi:hypothetical protein